jgi:hypothetical protein
MAYTEERDYLDPRLVDASESAQVVWDVLSGIRELGIRKPNVQILPLAAGAEMAPVVAPIEFFSGSGEKNAVRAVTNGVCIGG